MKNSTVKVITNAISDMLSATKSIDFIEAQNEYQKELIKNVRINITYALDYTTDILKDILSEIDKY